MRGFFTGLIKKKAVVSLYADSLLRWDYGFGRRFSLSMRTGV